MEDRRPLNITLLAGGISAEREISLLTGAQIAQALRDGGHEVFVSDISPDDLSALDHRPCDLVFPALHGLFGEDGQVQQLLEERGLPYVGSGPRASKMAMDKVATKSCLLEHQVPTAPWQVIYAHKYKDDSWSPTAGIGYPCVIKPIAEGSSVGCRICPDQETARAHLREFLPRYHAMMIERFLDGPELTVGVLDDRTLPVIQIKPATPFYDYQSKYFREDTQYLFDIDLPAPVLEAVQHVALQTHRCVGARHLSRVDVIVERRTNEPFVLEINTMPGCTSHSLVPKAAARAGLGFIELCDRLARMALRDAAVNSR
jgi:D-alanine-D-alanine ligase